MLLELFAEAASTTASYTDWLEKGLTFLIGAIGGWISGTLKVRGQKRVAIDALVQKLIELSMQYPHLERDSYCSGWTNDGNDGDDDRTRYENYCCLVFNTIERAWEQNWPRFFCKAWRHSGVRSILHVDELICRHHAWWSSDHENLDGYSQGFRDYVSWVTDKCRRERKL